MTSEIVYWEWDLHYEYEYYDASCSAHTNFNPCNTLLNNEMQDNLLNVSMNILFTTYMVYQIIKITRGNFWVEVKYTPDNNYRLLQHEQAAILTPLCDTQADTQHVNMFITISFRR